MTILYNGNNEKFLDEHIPIEQFLPFNWTNSPTEAMKFAYVFAHKYKSKMAVIVLEDADLECFELKDIKGHSSDMGLTDWYEKQTYPETATITIYREHEMQKYLEKHAYPLRAPQACDADLECLLGKLSRLK